MPSCTYGVLLLCLFLNLPAWAMELDEDEAPAQSWTEIKEPKKGATCMDMCLKDGEALFDCEYYCIQTARVGPLTPRGTCSVRR